MRIMARTVTARRVTGLGLGLALLATACGGSPVATPILTGEPPTTQIPVIVDADFDLSDLAAIAIMLRDPKLDIRAIAIDGTGLVHCQAGRLMARYVLDELGAPDIPFGCGREAAGPDGHSFPADWRATADAAFGLDIKPRAESGVPLSAVEVIEQAVADSPSAPTIVSLGPLTNLEDAFTADPKLADRVAGIHAMLGTIEAPGNVFVDKHTESDHLEWNAYADPSAVAAVFGTDVPLSIVPLDATDDVPVPPGLTEQLADVRAGGADLVHELLVRNPIRLASGIGQQLWDELAALTFTNPDLADWTESALTVDELGRLVQDEAGRPARFASAADRPAVEAALIEALGRGDPRATPFQLAGQLGVTFDGRTCAITGHSDREGPHRVDFKHTTGKPAGVAVVGTVAPHTWQDLLDILPDANAQAAAPDWVVVGPVATDDTGTGAQATATADLTEGFSGPICYVGTWPDVVWTPGPPFEVGSGAIGS